MLDNWFYIIPNIFFGILLLLATIQLKKNISLYGKNYLPFFIILIYFLSASLIYIIEPTIWYPYFHESSYSAINFTIYSVFLFLFLYPSLYLKPIPKNLNLPVTKIITSLMIIMSLLGIFSFIYQVPYALQGLIIGASDLRVQMNTEGFSILPKNSLTTLAVGVSFFYLFYIAFFYLSIYQKKSLFIKIGLLIGSLSYLISGLAFMTRDVFVFYGMGFLFVHLYLGRILTFKARKNLKKLFIVFGILMISVILAISSQRFSDRKSANQMIYGTVGYIAQQPFVFSETIEKQHKFYGGALRFPQIASIIGEKKEIKRTNHYEWSFGTFIKDFYATGGFIFLIFITLLFVPFFYFKLKVIHKKNFYRNMIVTLFYFQFMTTGIFYFKLGSRSGNIYIMILSIFYFATLFKLKKKKKRVYEL